jgi:hypothetical protein
MAVILGGFSASPNVPHVEMGRISGFCLSKVDANEILSLDDAPSQGSELRSLGDFA